MLIYTLALDKRIQINNSTPLLQSYHLIVRFTYTHTHTEAPTHKMAVPSFVSQAKVAMQPRGTHENGVAPLR
jgi:hypothetical protein